MFLVYMIGARSRNKVPCTEPQSFQLASGPIQTQGGGGSQKGVSTRRLATLVFVYLHIYEENMDLLWQTKGARNKGHWLTLASAQRDTYRKAVVVFLCIARQLWQSPK